MARQNIAASSCTSLVPPQLLNSPGFHLITGKITALGRLYRIGCVVSVAVLNAVESRLDHDLSMHVFCRICKCGTVVENC